MMMRFGEFPRYVDDDDAGIGAQEACNNIQ